MSITTRLLITKLITSLVITKMVKHVSQITSISIPKNKISVWERLKIKMLEMGIKSVSALFVEFMEEFVTTDKEVELLTTDILIRYTKKEIAMLDEKMVLFQKQKQDLLSEIKMLEEKKESFLQRKEKSKTEQEIMEKLIVSEMEIIKKEYHGKIPEKAARSKAEQRVRTRMKQKS